MNHKQTLILSLLLFIITSQAKAMMPSHVYTNRIANSSIMAIVKVEKVEPFKEKKYYEIYKAYFRVEAYITLPNRPSNHGNNEFEPNISPPPPTANLCPSISKKNNSNQPKKVKPKIGEILEATFTTEGKKIGCYPGGPIIYHINKDDRAFVAIGSLGGGVTAYTVLTTELEDALKHSPETIGLNPGGIYLK